MSPCKTPYAETFLGETRTYTASGICAIGGKGGIMGLRVLGVAALLAGVVSTVCFSASAQATTIDFSNVAAPGTYTNMLSFVSSGFQFQSYSSYANIDSATDLDPNLQHPAPGDLFAVFLYPYGGGQFSPVGGGTFTLNSLDLNWWDFYQPSDPHNWSITGTFADGSTATVRGVLQPGQFVPETLNWSKLESVSFSGSTPTLGWIGIDNVVVNVTPLPPAWTMMMIGLAGFGFVA